MPVAVVDTGVVIGMIDSGDQRHEVATEIGRGIDRGDLPTGRVTNYVVLEALNWIHGRRRHETAVEAQRRLKQSAGFEIVQAAQTDFSRAEELFGTYEGLSFGDATIVAYMERTDVEYLYSFDDDFDAIDDITRLAIAENPF
jgi:predicted nucleic acid-binding protein